MSFKQTQLGYEFATQDLVIFFGGVHAQLSQIQQAYPNFNFIRVKQTHGDKVVESVDADLDYQIEADAHFSQKKETALCVITADCIPAFFFHRKTGLIAGVHAGWRGVVNKILLKTIDEIQHLGINSAELEVYIGPHIQQKSFEVAINVREQILKSLGDLKDEEKKKFYISLSNEKCLLDLNLVATTQLISWGIQAEKITNLNIDTFEDLNFHSHRRDKEKAGRQISFAAKKI